jgi:hypothetical protein
MFMAVALLVSYVPLDLNHQLLGPLVFVFV